MRFFKQSSVLVFLYLISISGIFAEQQICRIIYGKKKIQESIKRSGEVYLLPGPTENCYQIGVEYNKFNKPINEKPIFTCCKKEGPASS